MAGELDGMKVAVLATDGVEQVELERPWQALEEAGAEPVLVSLESGTITAFQHIDKGDAKQVDALVSSADPDDYGALVLPGGVVNGDFVRADADAVAFVTAFFDAGKPVAAICHAPWVLAEDDVRSAAEAFLADWAAGDTAAAAGATTDADVATALLEQTATDLPEAVLSPEVGQVTVEDGAASVDWTATWDLAAAPDWSYPPSLRLQEAEEGWDVVADPPLVHPELGEGQRLLLARELPDPADITDAAGQPLFAPTEVVNVGVDPAQVTDLPALAAGLSSATGIPAEEIVADVQAAS